VGFASLRSTTAREAADVCLEPKSATEDGIRPAKAFRDRLGRRASDVV
jgi:hypothetical protein